MPRPSHVPSLERKDVRCAVIGRIAITVARGWGRPAPMIHFLHGYRDETRDFADDARPLIEADVHRLAGLL